MGTMFYLTNQYFVQTKDYKTMTMKKYLKNFTWTDEKLKKLRKTVKQGPHFEGCKGSVSFAENLLVNW